MKSAKWLSLLMITGVLTFTSCKENKKHDDDDDERTEQMEEQNEHNETSEDNDDATTVNMSQKTLDITTLPESVKTYVAENFNGYQIASAEHDPMCTGEDAIDVAIKKANEKSYSVIFSPDWKFVQLEEDVDFSLAPPIISEILKKDYSDYIASQQIEKLTMADKSTQYLVDIAKDNISKEVIFDEAGKVVCVSK